MRVHHVGYLVKNIAKAREHFVALGYTEQSKLHHDELRKIVILFMEKDGYVLELVSPLSSDSIISNLLKRYRNSPYHMCYESSALAEDVAALAKIGFMPLGDAAPATALGGGKAHFLLSPHLGMIEIFEQVALLSL
jgi:methylmalonyl-CoA/ethylmalonyl-CoA epimerase